MGVKGGSQHPFFRQNVFCECPFENTYFRKKNLGEEVTPTSQFFSRKFIFRTQMFFFLESGAIFDQKGISLQFLIFELVWFCQQLCAT